ncbi:hypothetical protein OBBRIDRAFT_795550 [Obba rivulosa]|uniref:RING-type domain-containing protein n=1 Tax=Obba rivulosa TaxID=1052685 RepID=A0A8E2AP99_9APHY|nr:hypothetical protein OBBRIDRAFT_795550 [Obba rivulosa]
MAQPWTKKAISISSGSSDPSDAARTTKRPRTRKNAGKGKSRFVVPEDVIELTESEPEGDERPLRRSQTVATAQPQLAPIPTDDARPSQAQQNAQAGPSRPRKRSAARSRAAQESVMDPVPQPPPPVAQPVPQPHIQELLDVASVMLEAHQPRAHSSSAGTSNRVNRPSAGPAEPAAEAPAEPQDPFDGYVASVLEIIPDVLPSHVRELVERQYPEYQANIVEAVLHLLFESPNYPKETRGAKGKRKREVDDDEDVREAARAKIDYGSKDRRREGGPHYAKAAVLQLCEDFPLIPVQHVRQVFSENNSLYAPAHLTLLAQSKEPRLPYKPKARPGAKGKGVAQHDAELEKEREWLRLKLQEGAGPSQPSASGSGVSSEDVEGGIECGCCFTEYPFEKMIQCPEAHLFCTDCMTSYASNLLGGHDANIVCMDQGGCKASFPVSELRRVLSPKLMELYERVKQRKEIEAAGLENLEECPFCEYKVVIENPEEKLFRCENEECGAVTCRQCKKTDHLPKSCKEMEEDKKLDVRHLIEEAMTNALMRNCPKCQKGFIKETGCNKMTCPNCQTVSCYICRKVIHGYDHFNNPPGHNGPPDPNKCALWDSVEQRHSNEVSAAFKNALEKVKRDHPELTDEDLKVDLPPAPPPGAGPAHPHAHPHGLQRVVYAQPVRHAQLPALYVPPPAPPGIHVGWANNGWNAQLHPGPAPVYNLQVNIDGRQVYPQVPQIPIPPVPLRIPAVRHVPVRAPAPPRPPRPARVQQPRAARQRAPRAR